jgi:hypothetical protein
MMCWTVFHPVLSWVRVMYCAYYCAVLQVLYRWEYFVFSSNYRDLQRDNSFSSKQYFECKRNSTELKLLWHINPLLGNDLKISSCRTSIDKWWFCKQQPLLGSSHVVIRTDANAIEEWRFLRGLCRDVINRVSPDFSKSVSEVELVGEWVSRVTTGLSRCEQVAEGGDISATQRKGNAHSWKPLSSNG